MALHTNASILALILVLPAAGLAAEPATGQGTVLRTADGQPCVAPVKPRPRKKTLLEPPPEPVLPVCAPLPPPPGPSNEELQQRLDAQQAEIDALKAASAESPPPPPPPIISRLRFSSFGEAHYAHLREHDPDRRVEQFNFDRIAVGFDYAFTPAIRLVSVLELEDGATEEDDNLQGDRDGDLHIEAAYAEFDLPRHQALRAGVFPLPIGIVNERHLPTDYYGVERPVVEQEIIPTTWSELGLGLHGLLAGDFGYDLAVHSGLLTPGVDQPNAFRARNGLQRSSLAEGSGLAGTARLKYLGIRNLELAGSLHYEEDLRQGLDDSGETEAWLYETHALGQFGRLGLRALWTLWDVQGAAAASRGRDTQDGYYLEGSWRFTPRWGAFVQWSEWDPGNLSDDAGQERIMAGFNWWPIPNIVFKFDFKVQEGEDGGENYGPRLGFGYAFQAGSGS